MLNRSNSLKIDLLVIAVVFPLLTFTSNSIWTSTTSITVPLTDYYAINSSVVAELPNLMFSAMFLVVAPTAPWVTNRFGIYKTLCLSAALMSAGSFCRSLSSVSFLWLMVGNALVSIAQPFVSTNLSAVALQCAGPARQGFYIGTVGVVGSVGTAWGFAVSSWLIQSAAEYGRYFGSIEILYLSMNLASLAGLSYTCYQQWRRSDIFVATSALETESQSTHVYFPVENRGKIAIALVVVCVLAAASNAITIVLEQILLDQGYGNSEVFVSGLLYLVPCIFFPLAFGILVDSTERETFLSVIVYLSTSVLQAAVLYSGGSLNAFYVVITFYGITSNVLSTVLLPTANRWDHGQHATTINTVYSWLNTLLTLALTLVMTVLPTQLSSDVFLVLAALCVAGSLSLPCFRTP